MTSAKGGKDVNAAPVFESVHEGELDRMYNWVPSTLPDGPTTGTSMQEEGWASGTTGQREEWVPPSPPAAFVGVSKRGKGKGKGKERAVDVGLPNLLQVYTHTAGTTTATGTTITAPRIVSMQMQTTPQLRPAFFQQVVSSPVEKLGFRAVSPVPVPPPITSPSPPGNEELEGGMEMELDYPEADTEHEHGRGQGEKDVDVQNGTDVKSPHNGASGQNRKMNVQKDGEKDVQNTMNAGPPPSPPQLFSSIPEQHSWVSRATMSKLQARALLNSTSSRLQGLGQSQSLSSSSSSSSSAPILFSSSELASLPQSVLNPSSSTIASIASPSSSTAVANPSTTAGPGDGSGLTPAQLQALSRALVDPTSMREDDPLFPLLMAMQRELAAEKGKGKDTDDVAERGKEVEQVNGMDVVERANEKEKDPKERLDNVMGELGDSVVALEGRLLGMSGEKPVGNDKEREASEEMSVVIVEGEGEKFADPPQPSASAPVDESAAVPLVSDEPKDDGQSSPLTSPLSPLSPLPSSPAKQPKESIAKKPTVDASVPATLETVAPAPAGEVSTPVARGKGTDPSPKAKQKQRKPGKNDYFPCGYCGPWWWDEDCPVHPPLPAKETPSVANEEGGRPKRKAAVEGREKINRAEESTREKVPRKRRKTEVEVKREEVEVVLGSIGVGGDEGESVSARVQARHGKGKGREKESVSVKIRVPRKSAKGAKEKGEAKEVVGVDAPIEQSASVPSRLTRLGSKRSEPKVVAAAAEPSTSTPTEPVEVSMEEDDTDAPSTRTRGVKRKSLVLDEVVVDEAVEPTKDTLRPDEPTKRQKNGEGEERMVDDDGEREVDHKENADDIEQGDTRSSSPDIPLSAVLRSKPEPPHSDSGSIFGMDIDDEVPPTTDEDEVMSTASALPPPPWLSASIRLPSPASPTSPTSPTSPSSPPHYFPPTEAESAPGSQTVPESPEPALALPSLPMEIRALIEAFISRSPIVVVASRSRTADLLPHLELTPTLKTKSGSKALTLSGKGKGKAKTLTEEEQEAEWGYAWLGLFRILALSEESVTSTVKGAQITVRWRFRVEWVRGGEYMFRDAQREVDVGRPWWVSSSRSKPLSSVSSRNKGYHRKSGKDEVRTPELYLAHWRAHPSYSRSLPVRPSSSTDATLTVPEDDNTKEDPSLELLPITFTATPFNVFLSPDAFPTGWFCAACGKVNAQNAMRHRRCASLLCARVRSGLPSSSS
jgi:hypothetical protein